MDDATNRSLLAKSGSPVTVEMTLIGHTYCVLNAVEALFGRSDGPTRLASAWLRFFGLADSDFDRFLRHLRVAAQAHDWGKANDGFEGAVTQGGEQAVRHEHLSALLLAERIADKPTLAWLRNAGLDEIVLLAAVISHHLKAGPKTIESPLMGATRSVVTFRSDHEDFVALWKLIQDEVASPCPPSIPFPTCWRKDEITARGKAMRAYLDKEKSRLRDDPERRRWLAAVRAGLIVADAVGSAVVRMDHADANSTESVIDRWVRDCFSSTLTGDDVWENVVKKRIAELRARGRWDDSKGHKFGDETGFTEFQCQVASQGPRVLLTAPCGSGKTLAAWNWITTQLKERPAARVLFLYPTRATATEGFRDYVSWAPEADAALMSGTANYELMDMFQTPENPGDPRAGRTYQADARLFALAHWKKRIFSATADQFFPFMQYQYGPICLLPLLAEAIVVVDEVHSFDESMFSTLKRFLKEFPTVPVLCMTATLPIERKRTLCDESELGEGKLKPYPETTPADLVETSGHPRYVVEWVDRSLANQLAQGALDDRKRVLWVSNRVSDCQAAFENFVDNDSMDPGAMSLFCYHSRFKLDDRKKRHKNLIQAFQDAARDGVAPRAVFGATTQVCEMSLDLDAEILVSELAPIASLIQRMGRCNRDSTKLRCRPIGRVYVIRPEIGREKPYEKEELDAAKRFVDKIAGTPISQDQLEVIYKECDVHQVEPAKLCPFLDSGPYAEGGEESFRDIDEFTVPCVLSDQDVTKVLSRLHERDPDLRKPIDGFLVPVPRRFANEPRPTDPRFPRWVFVAPVSRYDALIGFDDRSHLSPGGPGS